MFTITEYLTEEHRECDQLYSQLEEFVDRGSWEEALKVFLSFKEETLGHFQKEEDVLFPAFEARTGIFAGPTQVMRREHQQARELLQKMEELLHKRDKRAFLSVGETFMILIQQHNMKEEQILYPMCDQHLDPMELVGKMQEI